MRWNAFTFAATSIGEPSDMDTPPMPSSRIQRLTSANVESPVLV